MLFLTLSAFLCSTNILHLADLRYILKMADFAILDTEYHLPRSWARILVQCTTHIIGQTDMTGHTDGCPYIWTDIWTSFIRSLITWKKWWTKSQTKM